MTYQDSIIVTADPATWRTAWGIEQDAETGEWTGGPARVERDGGGALAAYLRLPADADPATGGATVIAGPLPVAPGVGQALWAEAQAAYDAGAAWAPVYDAAYPREPVTTTDPETGETTTPPFAFGMLDAGSVIPGPATDEYRAEARARLHRLIDDVVEPIRAAYPETERLTWDQQAAEAAALVENEFSDAPLIRLVAASLGVDPVEYARGVLEKRSQFVALGAAAVATRQAGDAAIAAASTKPEVNAAVFEAVSKLREALSWTAPGG